VDHRGTRKDVTRRQRLGFFAPRARAIADSSRLIVLAAVESPDVREIVVCSSSAIPKCQKWLPGRSKLINLGVDGRPTAHIWDAILNEDERTSHTASPIELRVACERVSVCCDTKDNIHVLHRHMVLSYSHSERTTGFTFGTQRPSHPPVPSQRQHIPYPRPPFPPNSRAT
jgi:hypothetical protein